MAIKVINIDKMSSLGVSCLYQKFTKKDLIYFIEEEKYAIVKSGMIMLEFSVEKVCNKIYVRLLKCKTLPTIYYLKEIETAILENELMEEL